METSLERAIRVYPIGTNIISLFGARDVVTGIPKINSAGYIIVDCKRAPGRMIFAEKQWASVEDEIDWSKPTKVEYSDHKGTYIVQSIGCHEDRVFSGVVIYSDNKKVKEGLYSDSFEKWGFKIFKGLLTL